MKMSRKRVLYIQYTNPTAYPPLEHSSQILAKDGWQVRMIGTMARGDSNALQFPPHANLKLELMKYCPPGLWQKLHYVRYCLWCLYTVLIWRPTFVYASDGWSYPIAYLLSYLPCLNVIMHEHDTPATSGGIIQRIIGNCRRKLARRATAVVCPQPNRAEALNAFAPKRLDIVFNCPSRDEWMPIKNHPSEHGLRLWFHGSIVPTQLPLAIVHAMKRCDFPIALEFAGYETIGHPGYIQEFLDSAQQLGLGDRVRYRGAIPSRAEMYAAASTCNVGLALFSMKFREPMVGASNKPFDYLACGLALLVPSTPEWQAFFIDRGCGLSCNTEDISSIAAALMEFQNAPDV